MQVCYRVDVQGNGWSFVEIDQSPLPETHPCPFSLLSFAESLSHAEDPPSTSLLDREAEQEGKKVLRTPLRGKEKEKSTEQWSALKPLSPGFNYFPTTPEKKPVVEEATGKLRTVEEAAGKLPTRRGSSTLFASAKGGTISLSLKATQRARTLLAEEADPVFPQKRKGDFEQGGLAKKLNFKPPGKGFRIPYRKSMMDSVSDAVLPVDNLAADNGELRRATFTGPVETKPRTQTDSWRLLAPLQSGKQELNQGSIPESPLLRNADLEFNASRAILPAYPLNYRFRNGVNWENLFHELLKTGYKVTGKWVAQHYRWTVWWLSGMSSDKDNELFTSETALQELKYRFHAEKQRLKTSFLLDLMKSEGDVKEQMVVLVAGMFWRGEVSLQLSLELSDGWTSIFAEVDSALQSKFQTNRIKLGSILAVDEIQVIRKRPEVPISFHLTHNHCTPVPESTKLGLRNQDRFFVPLGWIEGKGGMVSNTWLCVERKYPVCYRHKNPGGRYPDLTSSQHLHMMEAWRKLLEELRNEAQADVKQKQFVFFKKVLERKQKGEMVDELEWLFARHLIEEEFDEDLLTPETLSDFQKFQSLHEKSLEKCVEDTVERLKRERGVSTPFFSLHLDFLVSEVIHSDLSSSLRKKAHFTLWINNLDDLKFQEGDVFHFSHLFVTPYSPTNGLLSLRSSAKTCYRQVCKFNELPDGLKTEYTPRTSIQDLTQLKREDLFDFVAFLLQDSDQKTLVCCSGENVESLSPVVKITLLDEDPLRKSKKGEVYLLKDVCFRSLLKTENLVLAFITQKTSSCSLKDCINRERLMELLEQNNKISQ